MIRPSRVAVPAMFAIIVLALFGTPGRAAPAGTEAVLFVPDRTLPAGGDTVEEGLVFLLLADRPGWADKVTLTVDSSAMSVADVEVTADSPGSACTAGPVVQCVLPGPHEVYERPDEDSVSFLIGAAARMSLTPKTGAAVGDSGSLTVTAKADDGPVTTETARIRIGAGVDLTAVDEAPRTVAPGGSVALRPRVRNSGSAAVEGLTAVLSADDRVLADTNFGNCTYGYSIACTFDTTLAPGDSYRFAAPFTIRTPRTAPAGSVTWLSAQWLTAAEWEDSLADYGDLADGRVGTGPDLALEEVPASALGAPQADTDRDDNGSSATVTVGGDRRIDVAAVGAVLPDRTGTVRTIAVGLVNHGPGTLQFPPFINNLPGVRVVLPAGVTVRTADERCESLAGYDPAEYDCMPRSVGLPPGRRLTFTFEVSVGRAAHPESGSVEVYLLGDGEGNGIDRDPRDDRAPITLSAAGGAGGGLPVTGRGVARTAGAGLLFAFAGIAVLLASRRRTVRSGR